MDPWSAGILAGANVAGSVITSKGNKAEARRARKQQLYLARNAHQIEVEDLRKAGLNPILSAGGSGARGSSVPQAQMSDLGHAVSNAMNSAIALKNAKAEVESKKMDVALKKVQERQMGMELEERKRQLSAKRSYGDMFYELDATKGVNPIMGLVTLLKNSAHTLMKSEYRPFRLPEKKKKKVIFPDNDGWYRMRDFEAGKYQGR